MAGRAESGAEANVKVFPQGAVSRLGGQPVWVGEREAAGAAVQQVRRAVCGVCVFSCVARLSAVRVM